MAAPRGAVPQLAGGRRGQSSRMGKRPPSTGHLAERRAHRYPRRCRNAWGIARTVPPTQTRTDTHRHTCGHAHVAGAFRRTHVSACTRARSALEPRASKGRDPLGAAFHLHIQSRNCQHGKPGREQNVKCVLRGTACPPPGGADLVSFRARCTENNLCIQSRVRWGALAEAGSSCHFQFLELGLCLFSRALSEPNQRGSGARAAVLGGEDRAGVPVLLPTP